jgi:hypothetical protein
LEDQNGIFLDIDCLDIANGQEPCPTPVEKQDNEDASESTPRIALAALSVAAASLSKRSGSRAAQTPPDSANSALENVDSNVHWAQREQKGNVKLIKAVDDNILLHLRGLKPLRDHWWHLTDTFE